MIDRRDAALRLLIADRLLDLAEGDQFGYALLDALRTVPDLLPELLDAAAVRELRGQVGISPAPLRVLLIDVLTAVARDAGSDEIAAACGIDRQLVEDYVAAIAEVGHDRRFKTLGDLAAVVSWDVVIEALRRRLSVDDVARALVDYWPMESSGDHTALLEEVGRRARERQRNDLVDLLLAVTGPDADGAMTRLQDLLFVSDWLPRDGIVSPEEHAALREVYAAIDRGAPDPEIADAARRVLGMLIQ